MTDTIVETAALPRCVACGKFAQVLAEENTFLLPPGRYCASCGWHEKKKRLWRQLPVPLQNLLTLEPEHPVGRAQLLGITKVPPPETVKTLDALKRWYEFADLPTCGLNPTPPPANRGGDGVSARVSCTQTRMGTCCFSCTDHGHSTYTLDPDVLRNMAENSTSVEDFCRRARNTLRDYANDNPPDNMEEQSDDYDYDNYDTSETDNFQTEVNNVGELQEVLLWWLRENRPGDYNRLQGVTPREEGEVFL